MSALERSLAMLRADVDAVINGHSDNTKMPCRVDLDGHDCCYVCNRVEAALNAWAKELAS